MAEPEPKHFTLHEIEAGIRKFKRRIDEVKAINPGRVTHNDAEVQAATRNIQTDLIEVFGPTSPEYITHGSQSIGYPDWTYHGPSHDYYGRFVAGLPKTIAILEGLIKRLEEKREDLGADPAARTRAAFEGLDLHPRIESVAAELYRDGYYRNAVGDAAIALIHLVQEKSRRPDLDGAALMTTIFSKNKPLLAFNDLKDKTEEDEQEGMMHLFLGAVLALRNPRAHALNLDSAEVAMEYISFLSMLAKRVDQAKRTA